MFDAIWYLPSQKSNVLPLLTLPPLEQRQSRKVCGIIWAGGQPKPYSWEPQTRQFHPTEIPKFSGPNGGWSLVFGNFPGYETDPDILLSLMTLKEMDEGLIGGTFKPGALETERHTQRVKESAAADKKRLDELAAQVDSSRAEWEAQRNAAEMDLLLVVAARKGIRKPDRMSAELLRKNFELACMTDDDLDGLTLGEWLTLKAGAPPEEVLETPVEELPDWEAPMVAAYSALHGTRVVEKKDR